MIKRITILLLLISGFNFAQDAINYFPQSFPHTWWTFDVYNLDSNGVRIDESKRTKLDSIADFGNYFDKDSYLIVSKTAPDDIINNVEYKDSSFLNFDGALAEEYFGFFAPADSGDAIDTILYDFISSIRDWYPLFKFDSPVGDEYLLLDRDTVITVLINDVPLDVTLNLTVNGQRVEDADNIDTGIGNFDGVKVFVYNLKFKVIVPLLPPPLPPVEIDVVTIPDTLWIGSEHWVIKELRPTVVTEDLEIFGIPSFYVFGEEKYLADFDMLVGVDETFADNIKFELKQNYPNPFNPSTNIEFSVPSASDVKLSVYNLLGQEVSILVNKNLTAGNYKITFNGENLSSGIYLYRLQTNGFNIVRKMTLIK
ncbi:MAG: T9SS type A sorting domain-containing protein [Chlorobi bacterium]|nr:T9SS type A sorting domain-containing protein [Chlorobiota bacterium]